MITTDQGAPATAEKVSDGEPAAKETTVKKAKAKAKQKKAVAKKANGNGAARPRNSVANFIRAALKKGMKPDAIVKAAHKAFPKKSPTVGYVNWIREHAPKVSTAAARD